MPYNKGEWVIDKNFGKLGYITAIDSYMETYSVKWVKSGLGAKIRAVTIMNFDAVELAPLDIQREDYKALQHLAVETGDKQWFITLGERLGGMVP